VLGANDFLVGIYDFLVGENDILVGGHFFGRKRGFFFEVRIQCN
jgi:hypothetical protein